MDGLAKERLGKERLDKQRLRGGRREAGAGRRALLGKVIGRGSAMGYFDGLTSGNFKTAPDGRRLFFPWGYLGRGYVLPSDNTPTGYASQLKTYYVVLIGRDHRHVGLPCLHRIGRRRRGLASSSMGSGRAVRWRGCSLPAKACRLAKVRRRRRGPSAREALWLMEICSLLFVCRRHLTCHRTDQAADGGAHAVFFGCCAAVIGYLLVIRGRTSTAP